MSKKNRPLCPLCDTTPHSNGKTSAGTQRWRCPACGHSYTHRNYDAIQAARFRLFITWLTQDLTLKQCADRARKSTRTLQRWFEKFWLIQVPQPVDKERIYDQIFIDGTYFNTKCLLIASTRTSEVITWYWCHTEDSWAYTRLFDRLLEPVVVTTDGQSGALKAIRKTWKNVEIQRCLIHVHRNIRRNMGLNPYLPANKVLKKLGENLLKVRTPQQAAQWATSLHAFWEHYGDWL